MPNQNQKNKILIVDDDPMIARMYQEKLSRDEFEVVLAFNGEEGLEKAEKEKPSLILLDIMMPKMNGYEMLKLLRAKEEISSIPVIILSSLGADPELIKKAKELDVIDIIDKGGVSAKEVVERVKVVLKEK